MDPREPLLVAFAGIFGLLVGSFLNVCIFRLPRNCMSIARGRSQCPRCRKQIAWYDNIPVFSWIALGGRCRGCRNPISPRYMMVELLTASLFSWSAYVQVYAAAGSPVERATTFAIQAYLLSAIVVSTFIDIDFEILPDEINYSGAILGLLAGTAFPHLLFREALRHTPAWLAWLPPAAQPHAHGLAQSLVGALVGGGAIYATGVLGTLLFRKRVKELKIDSAMGFGDVKYLVFLGAFLGWEGILLTFLVSVVAGALFGIAKYAVRREFGKVPFGPFLSVGALAVLFAKPQILLGIRSYLSLFRPPDA